jgi:8-oxo-dGTP diphosphatase
VRRGERRAASGMSNLDASPPALTPDPTPRACVEVAAGLIFRDGRLLITQRRPGDHLGGLWEFPGGKRQPDETFAECLRRELREELGIAVAVGELLQSIIHDYPDRRVHLKFFVCRLTSDQQPQTLGCAALRWVCPRDLAAYDFPPADARLLQSLLNRPEFHQSPA